MTRNDLPQLTPLPILAKKPRKVNKVWEPRECGTCHQTYGPGQWQQKDCSPCRTADRVAKSMKRADERSRLIGPEFSYSEI